MIFELYESIWIPIITGLVVGLIILILEKTNWKGLFIKTRILWILKKYNNNRNNTKKEAKYVRKLGLLLDKGSRKIQSKGFSYFYNGNTIKDKNFGIHLTRRDERGGVVHQFLIRKLNNGESMNPDIAYFSEGYPQAKKDENRIEVLNDFIKYFKKS